MLKLFVEICGAAYRKRWAALCFCILSLSGCSGVSLFDTPREYAFKLSRSYGFQPFKLKAGNFDLQTFLRTAPSSSSVLRVYLEGDGQPWSNRYSPPADPTPRNPVALQLANAAPSNEPVAYIARPCQFLTRRERTNCWQGYWSSARFAPEVVVSASSAIDQLKTRSRASDIHLVGYSGGGVLAVLVAAQRKDIVSVTTVAAPLDLDEWARIHDASPLAGSLKPLQADLIKLGSIRQHHFVGTKDSIVPPTVLKSFVKALGHPSNVEAYYIDGYDHACCWVENWERLLSGID